MRKLPATFRSHPSVSFPHLRPNPPSRRISPPAPLLRNRFACLEATACSRRSYGYILDTINFLDRYTQSGFNDSGSCDIVVIFFFHHDQNTDNTSSYWTILPSRRVHICVFIFHSTSFESISVIHSLTVDINLGNSISFSARRWGDNPGSFRRDKEFISDSTERI